MLETSNTGADAQPDPWARPRPEVDQVRVLVVEDDAELAETVALGLRREGMAIDLAGDGHDALARVDLVDYDVVVLDRDLPGLHGDEVCRSIVAGGRPSRVLMLTAATGSPRRSPRSTALWSNGPSNPSAPGSGSPG
jgi:CheY-like chemotaxis protein